jgi:membrane-associated protease RseP (regulator of RpoE activity)
VSDWTAIFTSYRVVSGHHEEIVQGVLHPGLDPDTPPVLPLLEEWSGSHFVHETPYGTELMLVRRVAPPTRERWGVHLALFLATLLTTTVSGAYFSGGDPFSYAPFTAGPWKMFLPVSIHPARLLPGLAFSLPLLAILLAHEMGHYLVARRRGLDVSPPYFIPAPQLVNLIGTFGAFIRLRSPLLNRAMLLDVGAAGPLASFVLSIPAAAVGLAWSHAIPAPPWVDTPFLLLWGNEGMGVGSSLVFTALARLFAPEGGVVVFHPLALAGWLGFFVTALNLFPIFQLDGGHIAYALLGARQQWVGALFLGLLLFLGSPLGGGWWGWWIWAALILLLGRGSVAHPPVFDPGYPLSPWRRVVGWACLAILVLTFAPVPFGL